MKIDPKTPGVHHIALRCTDMNVTKKFYQEILGFKLALDTPEIIGLLAGAVIIVFKKAKAAPGTEVFKPFKIGLDHIALACETETELHRIAQARAAAGVENTGVKLDETLQKLYVAFKDPDRIQWEFYMM